MPTVNMNFAEVEVKYEPQTQSAGLPSDGELVQAVSEPPSVQTGGGGKANMDGLALMKHVDAAADAFEFVTDDSVGRQAAGGHDDWIPIDTISPPVNRDTRDAAETHHFNITLEEATIASPRVEQLGHDTSDDFLF